jgi:outer membrane lipoprotein-sorting protein
MTQIPIFVISLCYLGQSAQTPEASPPSEAAQTPQIQGEALKESETPAERVVREAADAVDGLEYLSVRVKQTIRAAGKTLESTGVYRRGPNFRSRLDLLVDVGAEVARRVNASDGRTCTLYEKILDAETYETFDVRRVMPLFETRDVSPEIRQQYFLFRLPFASPGEMLRGYLSSMRFESTSDGVLGDPPRPVVVVEGRWRDDQIPIVAQNQTAKRLDDLPEGAPQYIRLHLDKETRFPIRVELYRKDKKGAYKPLFQLDFTEVSTEKVPDSEFIFDAPTTAQPVDRTDEMVDFLNQFPEKAAAPGRLSRDEAVAEPLVP